MLHFDETMFGSSLPQLFVGGPMSYLRYLCLFGLSLPLVVCMKAHVLFTLFVLVWFFFTSSCLYEGPWPSYKQLEVKTNQTNTNNVNMT
jgi:hypothetical protein